MPGKRRLVISGGIGSGKSMVRQLLARAGFQTIDADSIGHEVLMADGPAFEAVAARWPDVVVGGRIDRSALGSIVFSDQSALQLLESITHPHIFGRINAQVERIDAPVAVEVPVLEHGLGSGWTRLIVDAPDQVRLERLLSRGMSEGDVRARMASQPSRARWLAMADLVVPNQGSTDELEETVRLGAAAILA